MQMYPFGGASQGPTTQDFSSWGGGAINTQSAMQTDTNEQKGSAVIVEATLSPNVRIDSKCLLTFEVRGAWQSFDRMVYLGDNPVPSADAGGNGGVGGKECIYWRMQFYGIDMDSSIRPVKASVLDIVRFDAASTPVGIFNGNAVVELRFKTTRKALFGNITTSLAMHLQFFVRGEMINSTRCVVAFKTNSSNTKQKSNLPAGSSNNMNGGATSPTPHKQHHQPIPFHLIKTEKMEHQQQHPPTISVLQAPSTPTAPIPIQFGSPFMTTQLSPHTSPHHSPHHSPTSSPMFGAFALPPKGAATNNMDTPIFITPSVTLGDSQSMAFFGNLPTATTTTTHGVMHTQNNGQYSPREFQPQMFFKPDPYPTSPNSTLAPPSPQFMTSTPSSPQFFGMSPSSPTPSVDENFNPIVQLPSHRSEISWKEFECLFPVALSHKDLNIFKLIVWDMQRDVPFETLKAAILHGADFVFSLLNTPIKRAAFERFQHQFGPFGTSLQKIAPIVSEKWFHGNSVASEVWEKHGRCCHRPGAFLVRYSSTPGQFALEYKCKATSPFAENELEIKRCNAILNEPSGVLLGGGGGLEKHFDNLAELVAHVEKASLIKCGDCPEGSELYVLYQIMTQWGVLNKNSRNEEPVRPTDQSYDNFDFIAQVAIRN